MAYSTATRTMDSASISPGTASVHELRQSRLASADRVDRKDKFDCLELLVQQSCTKIVGFRLELLAGFLEAALDSCFVDCFPHRFGYSLLYNNMNKAILKGFSNEGNVSLRNF